MAVLYSEARQNAIVSIWYLCLLHCALFGLCRLHLVWSEMWIIMRITKPRPKDFQGIWFEGLVPLSPVVSFERKGDALKYIGLDSTLRAMRRVKRFRWG